MPSSPRRRPVSQPHDALFKWTFSQREHAAGLLAAALPRALAKAVVWSTLRQEKGSFVDRALRSRHSDLLLSARMGEERVYVYVLVEQQRRVEPLMVFRMGLYMMRVWEHLVRDRPRIEKLPPIVPLLIHHSDTGWTAATSFPEIVAATGAARAALRPHIPSFRIRLIDVGEGRAGDLVERALTALGKIVLWCLSVAGDDARMEQEIGRIAGALDEVLQAPNGLAALEALLRYLWATHVRLGPKKVARLFEKAAGPRGREAIVTWLDEIERRGVRKGRAEGRIEGRAQGRAQALLEQLEVRFGAVPEEARARVMAANEAALAQWTVRVLSAPTLEEVLEADGKSRSHAPLRKRTARRRAPRG